MLTFGRISRSLLVLVALALAAGAATGSLGTVATIGFFAFLLVCLDPKPAWRWFFDAPDRVGGPRASRIFLHRRVTALSPHEQRTLTRG